MKPPPLEKLWLLAEGAEQDVVVSTRMRLARNVDGYSFKSRFKDGEDGRLLQRLREAVAQVDKSLQWVDLVALDPVLRDVLYERHLVSAEHVQDRRPHGVAASADGTTSIMLLEEDHLRLQVFAAGLELSGLGARIDGLDDALGELLPYSFDPRFGYLTSCPTNTGTGLRVSVMLHLPALSFRREAKGGAREPDIVKVHKAAQKLGLTVRGTHGESSRAEGDFYQISNQVTLGRSPEQAVADLQEVLEHVVNFERKARQILLEEDRVRLEDLVWRAWAILGHARRISSREALAHLSALRLGTALSLIAGTSLPVLHALMIRMQPGHLQWQAGRELPPAERDMVRAALIRDTLQPA